MKAPILITLGIVIGLSAGMLFRDTKQDDIDVTEKEEKFGTRLLPPARVGDIHGPLKKEFVKNASPGVSAVPDETPFARKNERVSNSAKSSPASEPSRRQLAENAARVERVASSRLDHFSRVLNLTEAQKDQFFPILARSSTAYHPALAISVSEGQDSGATTVGNTEVSAGDLISAKTADEMMSGILSEDQKMLLADALIEEDLWWNEIISDLASEVDQASVASAAEATSASADGQPDTSYEGNSGIGALLQSSGASPQTTVTPETGSGAGFSR